MWGVPKKPLPPPQQGVPRRGVSVSVFEQRMHKRKLEDARLAELQADVHQTRVQQHLADATERSARLMEAALVKQRAEELRQQQKAHLEQRRRALQDLLDKEQKMYQAELKALETTADQRKERLMERARELRQKREKERGELAENLQYRRWRESVDELRSSDAKLHALKALAARDEQVFQKALERDKEEQRDRIFAALWQEEYAKKLKREEEEQERAVQQRRETRVALQEQLALQGVMRERESEERKREITELRKAECERALQDRRKRTEEAKRNEEKRQELIEAIAEQKKEKEAQRELTWELERQYLQAEKEQDALLERKEQEEKEVIRRHATDYREALLHDMQKKKENQHELERLYMKDQEKDWQKQDAQIRREEEGRRRLLEEVIQSCKELCHHKAVEAERLAEQKRLDLAVVQEDFRRFQEDVERKKLAQGHMKARYREELNDQLKQATAAREAEKRRIEDESEARKREERRIDEALEQEKAKQAALEEAVKTMREQQKAAMDEALAKRTAAKPAVVVAPWDRDS
ncbi:conserved hypothetical protein [Neospora caninum Liverpool]|uniref:Cilia- and flagella-associated protein 53 n=1 Tax=Neospora caninum (strain Liverpool) TaxID=572307 RepID=F0VIS0_NEOCL|nr:conserved hypothetical protein [Neospora caninum Liverpool]CBZ53631.1 conserved hypothetical protein [Neospora caninum Liverpool]CEL67622.1 TPA: hypothetical protein BN1204_034180 [Neospora caninum Liverpool]|eukprot:XP_003883663.1 conserved hypothetical protein [Neospora caninum Liverpool]